VLHAVILAKKVSLVSNKLNILDKLVNH